MTTPKTTIPALSLLVVPLMAVCLSGCANRNDEMEAQIMAHDAQIRQMQPVQADAWNQVQAMREEIQDLRGQLADLRRIGGSGVLVDKLNRHEEALHQIETAMALKFDLGEPIAPVQSGGLGAAAPAAAGAAAGTAGALAQDPANPVSLTQATSTSASAMPDFSTQPATTATAASGGTWGQETPRPKAPQAQADMTVALYEAGVNAFNARQYNDALRSFDDFLKNFGNDPKAPQAQYYLAECYFQTNQFSDAALAYDVVITKYPKSNRAPGAYLKQGICFSKMKQKQAARARMNELIRKYPQSPEAARAKTFLKTNK